MKLQRGILSLLTVLLIFVAVGAAVAWRLLREEATAAPARPELPDIEGVQVVSADQFMGAQPVEGAEVVRDTLWVQVTASGRAAASRQSQVATRRSGVVQRVLVREGQRVRAGDLLVQLDTVEAAMNLLDARITLSSAEVAFQERMLYAGDILTGAERENRERIVRIEIGLTRAEIQVARQEMEMELTQVRAPFDGWVADLQAVEGAYMGNGNVVLTLAQLHPIRVEVHVLEAEIGYLAPGRSASIRFNALPDETFTGTVETVNPLIDRDLTAGRVTITLPNPDGRILPGSYAWVNLNAQAFPDRILVPREAITTRGEFHRPVVFVVKNHDPTSGNGVAEWRYVALGRRNDTYQEIVSSDDTSMVEPGELVLVEGHHFMAHDIPVRLVENALAAGARPGR